MVTDIDAMVRIGAAALGGLAVGIEREWSGHAIGPNARFAGLRTFMLLGGLAGIAGWLWDQGASMPAVVLLVGGVALVVAAYTAASRHSTESTTEVAGLVVLGAAFLAGSGYLTLSSALVATTVLVLVEKSRLHDLVGRLNDEEIRAGARFGVMAVVILPLLPDASYGPFGAFQPRALWALVLLFTGISFAGYAVRRAIAGRQGDALAGLMGGIVSSTQVTLVHARTSRSEPRRAMSLASGAIAASTVLFVRTELAAAVLSQDLALALLPYIGAGLISGLVASAATLRRSSARTEIPPPRNPLQLRDALQMAVVFQLVIVLAHVMRDWLGDTGLVISGAIAGVTDVDAATISMARSIGQGVAPAAAAQAVAAGILSNTILKLLLAVAFGDRRFGLATGAGLLVTIVAIGAVFLLWM